MRKKAAILIITSTLFLVAVGGFLTQKYFLKSYELMEVQSIREDFERIDYSLKYEIDNLAGLASDWAAWDDTYAFMSDKNQDYLDSNLVDGTFIELGINFILYYDPFGKLFHHKAFNLDTLESEILSQDIEQFFRRAQISIQNNDPESRSSGIFRTRDSVVIYASNPILTSDDEGPVRGTLVFGKTLEGSLVEHLSQSVGLNLILSNSWENAISSKYQEKLSDDDHATLTFYRINNQMIAGYAIYKDSENNPIFSVFFEKPRTTYLQGLKTISELLIYLMISGVFFGAMVLLFLDRIVLSRVQRLITSISSMENSQADLKKTPDTRGKDEISFLTDEIQKAFSRLEESRLELSRHLEFEKIVLEISTRFINLPFEKVDKSIDGALAVIGDYTQADRTYLFMTRNDNSNLVDNTHEWCNKEVESFKEELQGLRIDDLPWWFSKLQKGKIIHISRVADMPASASAVKSILEMQSVRSIIAVPLIVNNAFIGFLGCDAVKQERYWTEDTRILLNMVSSILINAIDRKNTEVEIRRNQDFLIRLNYISKISIQKSDLASTSYVLSRQLKKLIQADKCILLIIDDKGEIIISSSGKTFNQSALPISHLVDYFRKMDKKVAVYDMSRGKKSKNLIGSSFQLDSFIAIPLESKNELIGAAILGYNKPHEFSPIEIKFCQQAIIQITLAIIKIKALIISKKRTEELQILRATIADITSELKTENLLQIILERALNLLKADGGELCKFDSQNQELKVIATSNLDKEYIGTIIKPGEGVTGNAIIKQETIVIDDYSAWSERIPVYDAVNIKSTMSTPMMIGERILGAISVFHLNPESRFLVEDQNLLELFAQHAAIALENAELFEKTQQMAKIDDTSGMFNKRAINEIGAFEINRARRFHHPITVALLDIDDFKSINDANGHLVGDLVLRKIAALCKENLRDIDIIGRFGGDEMVFVLPESTKQEALKPLERLRDVIEKTSFQIEGKSIQVTVSLGLVSAQGDIPDLDILIKQADDAMYRAKNEGKNCIRVFRKVDEIE